MTKTATDPTDTMRGLEDAPAAVLAGGGRLAVAQPAAGQAAMLTPDEGLKALSLRPHLVCHVGFLVDRLGLLSRMTRSEARSAVGAQAHFDLAELFAFVYPARPALPSPAGIAEAVGIANAAMEDGLPNLIRQCARTILAALASDSSLNPHEAARFVIFLERANWPWARLVRESLARRNCDFDDIASLSSLNIPERLPDWEDKGWAAPPDTRPVEEQEVEAVFASMAGPDAEARAGQRLYCAEAAQAFAPRDKASENEILLAEAGTGLGKTLGYLAPAHLWARRNGATVWISTYSRNLQHQIQREANRAYPDKALQKQKVVIRKGRENYLCLLNFAERIASLGPHSGRAGVLGVLIARWVMASRDGDMVGGDFPSWLPALFTFSAQGDIYTSATAAGLGITDRRGECVHSACAHYRKCFIERAIRAARKAEIVIANHALVITQAALDQALEPLRPKGEQRGSGRIRRLILDEGHHIFDAADSAFSSHLTAMEAFELRRWLRGGEPRGRRARSLASRIGELIEDNEKGEKALAGIIAAARILPGPGWQGRIRADMPDGPFESFLALIRAQVLARSPLRGPYMRQAPCHPLPPGLDEVKSELEQALKALMVPISELAGVLLERLDSDARRLDNAQRARIEATVLSLKRRGEIVLRGWRDMLASLDKPAQTDQEADKFVSWFAVDYAAGREGDVGMHRHWIDPTIPLAEAVLKPVDGAIITSATLKDRPPDVPDDWASAEMRTGVRHLPFRVRRSIHDSPFDYAGQTRILAVTDVDRNNDNQIAAAYRELFLAARGGALGLFTSIDRLRRVHKRLLGPLGRQGLTLYAQHVDPMDNATLVDLFRAETDSCLLGATAMRDGIDVPGQALRLIVLDRVPWSRPDILERTRSKAFGGGAWRDMMVRLRLRQAFGRLVRKHDDRGVFVVLDSRLTKRFTTAFPSNVEVERVGLVDTIETVERFLAEPF
ncbi:MAG: ATP-dependent DNA helicase [Hyphomicrobiales bacterium]